MWRVLAMQRAGVRMVQERNVSFKYKASGVGMSLVCLRLTWCKIQEECYESEVETGCGEFGEACGFISEYDGKEGNREMLVRG